MADTFYKQYFGAKAYNTVRTATKNDDPEKQNDINSEEIIETIEKVYWETVEHRIPCTVEYGSDLSTAEYGSGFPRNDESPWNLNTIADAKGSLLRSIGERISGVNEPWLYFGMLFSTFCWHHEDDALGSVSFNHGGAAKLWYGAPGDDAALLEEVFKKLLPALFEDEPDLMTKLATMINPSLLQHHGVHVVRAVHRPGEFIITFPNAYHGGFNTGFNLAEAVNFAAEFWLPAGLQCAEKYALLRREPLLSVEMVAVAAARAIIADKTTFSSGDVDVARNSAVHVLRALERIIETELSRRALLIDKATLLAGTKGFEVLTDANVPQCAVCLRKCFLSFVRCDKHEEIRGCLCHAEEFCECGEFKARRGHETRKVVLAVSVAEIEKLSDTIRKQCYAL